MDEQPNKGSLRGRGRDIMRGPAEDDEQTLSSSQPQSGSWLPQSDEDEGAESYFENDEDVLKWMEVDPEANRPTTIPDTSLIIDDDDLPATGDLYPDPDFDSIFGASQEQGKTPSAPSLRPESETGELDAVDAELLPHAPTMKMPTDPRKTETQTLDDIFSEPDPTFDELFGDVVPGLPGPPTEEIPLPATSELFAGDDLLPELGTEDSGPADEDMIPELAAEESDFAESESAPEYTADEAESVYGAEEAPTMLVDEAEAEEASPMMFDEEEEAEEEVPTMMFDDAGQEQDTPHQDMTPADFFGEDKTLTPEESAGFYSFLQDDEDAAYSEEDAETVHADEDEEAAYPEEAAYAEANAEAVYGDTEEDLFPEEHEPSPLEGKLEADAVAGPPSESRDEYEPVQGDFRAGKPIRAEKDLIDEAYEAEADFSDISPDRFSTSEHPELSLDDEAPEAEEVSALDEYAPEGAAVDEQPMMEEALPLEEVSEDAPPEAVESNWLADSDSLSMEQEASMYVPPEPEQEDWAADVDFMDAETEYVEAAQPEDQPDMMAEPEPLEMADEIEPPEWAEPLAEREVTALDELAPEGAAVDEQPMMEEALPPEEVVLEGIPESALTEAIEAQWLFEDDAEPIPDLDSMTEAEAFVSSLEREARDEAAEAPPTASETVPEDEWVSVDETVPTAVGETEALTGESRAVMQESADVVTAEDRLSVTKQPVLRTLAEARMEMEEAVPLAEMQPMPPIDLRQENLRRGAIDSLVPSEPETLPPGHLPFEIYEEVEADYPGARFETALEAAEDIQDDGGIDDEELTVTRSGEIALTESSDPFGARPPRTAARDLFKQGDVIPDQQLLEMFVDENRLRELFAQIEALQEEIVENVRGERGNTDVYQEELLAASNLLMHSKENYDEARAIVYRVRSDLNRERRVDADIMRFRPLLTNIYIGVAIVLVVLALIGQLFIGVGERTGVPLIGHGFYPALFGAVGAWLSGVFAIYRHTIVQRDFDPNHMNWYIINPLIGLVSGFLAYLVLLTPNATSLSTSFEVIGSSPFTWIIAAGVGLNQNALVEMLNTARQRVAPTNSGREER